MAVEFIDIGVPGTQYFDIGVPGILEFRGHNT